MTTTTIIQYSCVIIRPAKNGFIIEGHFKEPLKDTDYWTAKTPEECTEIIAALAKKIL